jgi:hypothetical protein
MTNFLEQHLEYLTTQLDDINNLVNNKLDQFHKTPDMLEYLKQEK